MLYQPEKGICVLLWLWVFQKYLKALGLALSSLIGFVRGVE